MGSSDVDQLMEMGFDQERAQLAVSKTGGSKCQLLRHLAPIRY